MASSSYCVESLVSSAKRLKISTSTITPVQRMQRRRAIQSSTNHRQPLESSQTSLQSPSSTRAEPKVATGKALQALRLPKAVQAVFLAPLRRTPTHGIPVCDLQIRSYSVRNLEVFTDFCLRAAYYLKLAAKGPVPLPRITERWTVPRSHFIFKKSQENFERITVRRLIQIQDGHPDTVALWLAYIQKHRYYGVGMKANVFEYGGLEVAKDLDAESKRLQEQLGQLSTLWLNKKSYRREDFENLTTTQPFKAQWGAFGPMAGTQLINHGRKRFRRRSITYYEEQANADLTVQYPQVTSSNSIST